MKRLVAICLAGVIATVIYGFFTRSTSEISLLGGLAFAASEMPSMFMVGLTIKNGGAADVLLGVTSPKAQMVTLVNPKHSDAKMIVPGNSTGILAMDGAHVMLRASELKEGGFIPLTLTFETAGQVSTRVMHAGLAQMSHKVSDGILISPLPQVDISLSGQPGPEGTTLRLAVENFTFYRGAEDARHVSGQGHAHLYLNGLKLGRLYAPDFQIGGLPPGHYVLEVVLNANDHRAYLDENGRPVAAQMMLEVTG
ncbi:copper chaperone PCu(A)C [Sulfitobacter sp. F26204]|uniref:copper chaperone PCu(A)C n=1 Tax=Sulfitobacter sp. F26204 TaxID=2996014 RepID=UPI00225E20C0|nr:copper chaperone PCu(A)C [Sulfitobacter sp. F26204]MCX7559733.1 copper chaperone PCu(A)C [Sulfitobacter sp. F26204]